MSTEAIVCLYGAIATFIWLQLAIVSIGNRAYSLYYESHCLIQNTGLCKLIYYKPKHFNHYSVHEVIFFFASYFVLIFGTVMTILTETNILDGKIGQFTCLGISAFFILYDLIRIIMIDISAHRESKFFEKHIKNTEWWTYPTANSLSLEFATSLAQIDKSDKEAIKQLEEKYICFARNYRNLKSVKDPKTGETKIIIDNINKR